MTVIGSAVVRIVPGMSGFGAAVGAGIAGAGSALTRAGVGASLLITAPIVGAVAKGISEAVSFESGLASVSKTTNLMGDDLKRLGDDVVAMANKMPFAREEILEVVAAAGRFGVANEDLLEFSEVALQLGTAADGISAANMTEQLTKIATATRMPLDDIRPLADAIIALGNDFPTTEGQIAHFTQRLSQISATLPVSAFDLAGIATGMLSVGIRAEAGGTATARAFNAINAAITGGGEKLEKISGIAGMTSENFAELFKADPTSGFLAFLKGVRSIKDEGGDAAAVLKDLETPFGDVRVRDAILRAANGYDTVAKAIDTSNDAAREGGALQTEYDKRVATTASQWVIFKNNASAAAMILGQTILPILNDTMEGLKPFLVLLQGLATGFAALPEPVRQFILGAVATVAIIGPLILIVGKLITLFGFLGGGIMLLAKPFAMLLWWIAGAVTNLIILGAQAVATAVIVVARLIWMGVTAIAQSVIFYAQVGVRMVMAFVVLAAQAVATTAIVVARIIVMAVTAVAQAAIFYTAVAVRMVAAFIALAAQVALHAALVIGHFISMGLAALAAAAQMALAWIIAIGPWLLLAAAIAGAVALIIIHWDTLKHATGVAWDWIKDKVGAVVGWVLARIEDLKNAIRDAAEAITRLPSNVGGFLGNAAGSVGGAIANVAGNIVGRANYGPVNAGSTYRVNEREQEFFTPGRSGFIGPMPNSGGPIIVQVDKVVLSSDMDVVQSSRALARQTAREMRAQGLIP